MERFGLKLRILLVYIKFIVIWRLECDGHKGGWMRLADLDTSRGDVS